MFAPPRPESVNAPLQLMTDGTRMLLESVPLQRTPVPGFPGFALLVSMKPEPVYLLGRPDGSEVPVPCRICGTWNPTLIGGRHFFLAWVPDVALDMTSVRQVQHYVGQLAFPSGWAASPWYSAPQRKQLQRRLRDFTEAFLEPRIDATPALTRANLVR